MSKHKSWTLSALLVLVPCVWLVMHFWWTCDDAYISFRYAKHLARGDGLIFNPGESPPVEGFSNLLWILLLTPLKAVGMSLPLAANVLSSLCALTLMLLVMRFARERLELGTGLALATGLFLATLPPFAIWSSSGLETMPFALALFATYSALVIDPQRPRPYLAGICAILAALLRADGALWCGFVFLAALLPWYWERRGPLLSSILKAGVLLTIVVALHFGWRHSYFGEWLPNTAKIKAGYSALRGERGLNYLVSFMLAVPSLAIVVVLASFGPLAKAARSMVIPSALLFVFLNSAYAVYVGGDFMSMGRFFIPSLPFVALLFAALARALGRASLALPFAGGIIALGLVACFDLVPVSAELRQRFHFRWNSPDAISEIEQWQFMDEHTQLWSILGRALALHTEPGEALIRGNIGATGYHSELVLLDQNGLVIPEVAESSEALIRASPGHDRRVDPQFFFDREPAYYDANLLPLSARARVGLLPDAVKMVNAGELTLERIQLPIEDGFDGKYVLRLTRFVRP